MKYYTGTTFENLVAIVKGGWITSRPPHRVWKEYSQNYIYMIPQQPKANDVTVNGQTFNKSIAQAFRMADFAIKELNHSKRVVLELSGLDDYYITPDKDGRDINAVKYPFDISTVFIKKVYIDNEDGSKDITSYITLLQLCYAHLDQNKFESEEAVKEGFNSLINGLDSSANGSLVEFIQQNSLADKTPMEVLEKLFVMLNENLNFSDLSIDEFADLYVGSAE